MLFCLHLCKHWKIEVDFQFTCIEDKEITLQQNNTPGSAEMVPRNTMSQNFWYKVFVRQIKKHRLQQDDISGKNVQSKHAKHMVYLNKTYYVAAAKLLSGNFRHNSANFSHNCGNFGYNKKTLSRKRLYGRMMTIEPLPRSLNLRKDCIPGKKRHNLAEPAFPFVLFFCILWSY